jgi:hypothetical protein
MIRTWIYPLGPSNTFLCVCPSTDLSRLCSSRVQPTRQRIIARTDCLSVPILFQIVSGVIDHTWIQMLRIFLTSLAHPACQWAVITCYEPGFATHSSSHLDPYSIAKVYTYVKGA